MKTLTKQTLEEKIEKIVKENIYGYECTDCHGGGANGQDKCIYCNGTGIVRWELELGRQELVSLFLDIFEEIVGENDHYTAGFTTRNELRKEFRAQIQELREGK